MKLAELSLQYRASGEAIRARVALLEQGLKQGHMSETEKLLLRRRITILTSMYRETLETSNYLARYYSNRKGECRRLGQGSRI